MDTDELRRAMEGQAGVVGLRFEADLSQQILDDVAGEPGAMPLLQHALWELWNRRHGGNLRASEYRAFGGVKQAITSTAEKVYADCSKPEQDQLRDIFLRLTRLDANDEGRDTRRRVPLGDLIPSGRDAASITLLLDKLASARLIVKTVNDDKTEVEVAHEALIRHWERLRLWLNEDRDALRSRESVSEAAREWDDLKRDDSLLNHRGERLELAIIAGSSSNDPFNMIEHQYLNACRDFYEREEKARDALRRRALIGLTSGLIVAMILAGFAIAQRNEAKKQERSARSGELAALAVSEISSHSDRAFLLGAESYLLEKNNSSISALMNLMQTPLGLLGYINTTDGDGYSLAFSPNGKLFVSAGCREFSGVDCTSPVISLWDVSNISNIFKLANFNDQDNLISSVAFSEDLQLLATGSWEGSVVVWDITNSSAPKEKIRIVQNNASVYSVAFLANRKIVAVGADNDISFWDISGTNQPILASKVTGDNQIVKMFGYPDGRTLIYGDRDGNIVFIDTSNIEKPRIFDSLHGYFTWDIALENNHFLMALANSTNEISLEDITNPKSPKPISHFSLPYSDVHIIGLNKNGTTLAIAGWNNLLALWDMSDPSIPQEIMEFNSPPSDMISLVFHPKLDIFTTGYINRAVVFWSSQNFSPLMELVDLDSSLGKMKSLAFLANGTRITTEVDNRQIRFWNVTDHLVPRIVSELNSNKSYLNALLSPSGKRMAAIDINGVVGIWDTSNILDARELFVLQTTLYTTFDTVEFSSDDNSVLLEDQNGNLLLWDISNPAKPISSVVDIKTQIESLALSFDGKKLAIGGCGKGVEAFCVAGEISVWDISDPGNPRELTKIQAHETSITSLTFSPLGDFLVSGSGDSNIIVWDANSYEQIGPLIKGHNDAVIHLTFSQDGTILSSVGYDGNIILWDMNPLSWLRKSCQLAGRNFTRAEWNRYFQGEEYHTTCPQWPLEPIITPTATP